MIGAARGFFKDILATRGRRTDVENTAFWAAAAAFIPANVLEDRKGRAVMRLLDIGYRVVKKASDIRAGLEDGSKTWQNITTSPHADGYQWGLVNEYLHSHEASNEDNTNKEMVRVDVGYDLKEKTCLYEMHRARVYVDTKPRIYSKFLISTTYSKMGDDFRQKKINLRLIQARFRARKSAGAVEVLNKPFRSCILPLSSPLRCPLLQVSEEAVQAEVRALTREYQEAEGLRRAKRTVLKMGLAEPREPTEDEIASAVATAPEYPIFAVSRKHFYAQFCKCTRYLIASKCDCQLCSYINENMRAWHISRGKWDPTGRCLPPGSCDACTPTSPYRRASSSPDEFMAFLLSPCGKCRPCDIESTGFPPKPAPTPVEAPAPPTARPRAPAGSDAGARPGSPAGSDARAHPGPTKPHLAGRRGELKLKDAQKEFMVYAPACVNGQHVKIALGRSSHAPKALRHMTLTFYFLFEQTPGEEVRVVRADPARVLRGEQRRALDLASLGVAREGQE